jgi:hypothetical protein
VGRWATGRSLSRTAGHPPASRVYSVAGPARRFRWSSCLLTLPMAPVWRKGGAEVVAGRRSPSIPRCSSSRKSAPEAFRIGSPMRSPGSRDRCGSPISTRRPTRRERLDVVSQRDRSRRGRGQPPERGRAPSPSRCRTQPLVCSILRPRRSDRRHRSPRARKSLPTKGPFHETTTECVLHRLHGPRPRIVPELRHRGFRRALGCPGDRGDRHGCERRHRRELGGINCAGAEVRREPSAPTPGRRARHHRLGLPARIHDDAG